MKPRNINIVISDIIRKIPTDQKDLIEELEKVLIFDMTYQPPESTIQWELTHSALTSYIAIPTEEWQYEVLSIFSTKPVEELQKSFNIV